MLRLHTMRVLSLATGSAFTFGYAGLAVYCAIAASFRYQHGINALRRAYAYDGIGPYMPTDTLALSVLCFCFIAGGCISLYLTMLSYNALTIQLRRFRGRQSYYRGTFYRNA